MARCQNDAADDDLRCDTHAGQEPAARPNVILAKLSLPRRLLSEGLLVDREGWRYLSKTALNPLGVTVTAEEAGRDPHRYGKNRIDSASEAFGGNGATNVRVPKELVGELYGQMGVGSMMLAPKATGKDKFLLQVVFSTEAKTGELPVKFAEHIQEILGLMDTLTWHQVFVYCNIPQPNGTVLHTVNANNPNPDTPPRGDVIFQEGDWSILPAQ